MKNIDFDLNGIRKLNEKVKSDENATIDNMDSSCLVSVLVYLCSDRTANWSQHLITKGKILNLFAATGHRNYAKSAGVYLQMIMNLEKEYPCLYKQFNNEGLSMKIKILIC